MKKLLTYILLFISITAYTQVPTPAEKQSQPILIKSAVIHVGNGEVINGKSILFENGKITQIDESISESGKKIIDASGKHVYPGFILLNTPLGIEEVSSIAAMDDSDEVGGMNPNVRSEIAYNTDSENIPTFRFNGILMAEPTPTGGRISGTSSLMQLDAWNWEDAVYKGGAAMHINWPSRLSAKFDWDTYTYKYEKNKNYPTQKTAVEDFFRDALAYTNTKPAEVNLKLEAMAPLFSGDKTLVIHSNQALGIVDAVKLMTELGVKKIAVYSGDQAVHIADFLSEQKIPVILPSVHSTPSRKHKDYDLPFKLAAKLTEAGVDVVLSHNGMLANGRNLAFYAGTAAAYGAGKEEALKMITLNPAKVMQVDNQTGTIEVGKDATLFISEGDALDMRTNNLTHAFIQGREIQLDARQQMLYQKFSEKYDHDVK